jgi:hypothetical protein
MSLFDQSLLSLTYFAAPLELYSISTIHGLQQHEKSFTFWKAMREMNAG